MAVDRWARTRDDGPLASPLYRAFGGRYAGTPGTHSTACSLSPAIIAHRYRFRYRYGVRMPALCGRTPGYVSEMPSGGGYFAALFKKRKRCFLRPRALHRFSACSDMRVRVASGYE
jgi:hypothetical protein